MADAKKSEVTPLDTGDGAQETTANKFVIMDAPVLVGSIGAIEPEIMQADLDSGRVSQSIKGEETVANRLIDSLKEGVADAVGVAKETVNEFATYYAPLIARQAMLEKHPDEKMRIRAAGHKRHLFGQMLANAASRGVALQQRQEQRFIVAINRVIDAAIKSV